MLKDVFSNNTLMSFGQLSTKYNIPRQDLHLRHYIHRSTTLTGNVSFSSVEKALFWGNTKMSISMLYKILSSVCMTPLHTLRDTWERECSVLFNNEDWGLIWKHTKSISVCNTIRSIQLKILHRMHVSPNCRQYFSSDLSPMCLKCKIEIGTLTHCFWSCIWLQRYWSDVICEIRKILGVSVKMNPLSLLLGLPDKNVTSNDKKGCSAYLFLQQGKISFCIGLVRKVPRLKVGKRYCKTLYRWNI